MERRKVQSKGGKFKEKEKRQRKGEKFIGKEESTKEMRKVQKYLDSEPDEGGSGLASEESELVVVMSLDTINHRWNFKTVYTMGARNRVGIGLSYRPARLHRLEELIPWNRFLGSLKVKSSGS
jgi:hypothetical protein